MAKQVGLVFVLLLCACSSTTGFHPTCDDICRSYTRDDVNHRYCVIACRESFASRANMNNIDDSYSSLLPNYFQNGGEFSMHMGEDYEHFRPLLGSDPGIWRKTTAKDPTNQGMFSVGIGKSGLLLLDGKTPVSELEKRASSFVRIGRETYPVNRGQYEPFIQLGKSIEEDGGDPMLELGNKIPDFAFDSGKPLMEGQHGKRASSFVRIGRSHSHSYTPSSVNRVRKSLKENEDKRASSFVRIGRSQNIRETKGSGLFLLTRKSSADEENGSNSFFEFGKPRRYDGAERSSTTTAGESPFDENEKRASSFVRIGKSPLDEEEKRASSFVRIGKSLLDEAEKRASSFVRIGKSPLEEEEKRASSFVRIGKSPLEEEKRASSFVRIGKSPLEEEEKRASSFVRIGKSPLEEEEKRASSFVRIGKSPLEEEKRGSSFVRIGKSLLKQEEKRASSFVRIGKSPLDKKEKRASSFVRIGKSPLDKKEKRASSFVRIGKSSFDDENDGSPFVSIGKSSQRKFAGSLLRKNKRPDGYESQKQSSSIISKSEGYSEPDRDQVKMNGQSQGKRYSAYWRSRKPNSEMKVDPSDRTLLRIPRPVVESLLLQNAGVTPLLSSRQSNQMVWIPTNDDERRSLG